MDINISYITAIISQRKWEISIIVVSIVMLITTITLESKNNPPYKADDLHISRSTTTSSSQQVTVDIEGAVAKPGIYHLKAKQRYIDAINAAGGMTKSADRASAARQVNLAAYLHDQDKIYIPFFNEIHPLTTPLAAISITPHSININKATIEEIDILPGIGKTSAIKIIQNRPYSSLTSLTENKIISKSAFEKIERYIHL